MPAICYLVWRFLPDDTSLLLLFWAECGGVVVLVWRVGVQQLELLLVQLLVLEVLLQVHKWLTSAVKPLLAHNQLDGLLQATDLVAAGILLKKNKLLLEKHYS